MRFRAKPDVWLVTAAVTVRGLHSSNFPPQLAVLYNFSFYCFLWIAAYFNTRYFSTRLLMHFFNWIHVLNLSDTKICRMCNYADKTSIHIITESDWCANADVLWGRGIQFIPNRDSPMVSDFKNLKICYRIFHFNFRRLWRNFWLNFLKSCTEPLNYTANSHPTALFSPQTVAMRRLCERICYLRGCFSAVALYGRWRFDAVFLSSKWRIGSIRLVLFAN